MKNRQQNNSRLTYFSGWHIALHNYDKFEIDSINQLVKLAKDDVLAQLAAISQDSANYFTINLAE